MWLMSSYRDAIRYLSTAATGTNVVLDDPPWFVTVELPQVEELVPQEGGSWSGPALRRPMNRRHAHGWRQYSPVFSIPRYGGIDTLVPATRRQTDPAAGGLGVRATTCLHPH